MKIMLKAVSLLLCLMLLLSSCGAQQEPQESDASASAASEEQTTAAEEEEPEDPFAEYPYGIQGLTLQDGEAGNGLLPCAQIAADAQCSGGYFWLQEIYSVTADEIRFRYMLSTRQVNIGESGCEPSEIDPTVRSYLAVWDCNAECITGQLELPEGDSTGIEYSDGIFVCCQFGSSENTIQFYDADFNLITEFTGDSDAGIGTFFGGYYYSTADGNLQRTRIAPDTEVQAETIDLDRTIVLNNLNGLFTGENGRVYALLDGIAGDLQTYDRIVVDVDSGEVCAMQHSEDAGCIYVNCGCCYSEAYQEDGNVYSFLTEQGWTSYRSGSNQYANAYVLSDRILFFTTETQWDENDAASTSVSIDAYSRGGGEKLGTLHMQVDGDGWVYLTQAPVLCEDDGSILLAISGLTENAEDYYRWDCTASEESDGMVVPCDVMTYEWSIPEYDDLYDPHEFVPSECPEELSDQRAYADSLEEKYGVSISISKECCDILGGYAIVDLSDSGTLQETLEVLDSELSKYPDGFFEEFQGAGGYIDGINIYLTGTLIGTNSDYLEYAGGFQTQERGGIIIAIDCTDNPYALCTSLHHEIAHAIETRITADYPEADDFNDENWNTLNPEDFAYTLSYGTFGYDDDWMYTYDANESFDEYNGYYGDVDGDEVYFVDSYSQTYPTEDRARLFEYIMADDDYNWVDWEACPHLQEKLNYFVQIIRERFDSSNWGDVRWERYLSTSESQQ